jgi:hypothetical protein
MILVGDQEDLKWVEGEVDGKLYTNRALRPKKLQAKAMALAG